MHFYVKPKTDPAWNIRNENQLFLLTIQNSSSETLEMFRNSSCLISSSFWQELHVKIWIFTGYD